MWLRLPIALAWIAAVVYVVIALPALSGSTGATPEAILPRNAAPLRAERISATRFSFPVLTRTAVVVHDPTGLPLARQAEIVRLAVRVTEGKVEGLKQIAGALPVTDAFLHPSASHPAGTTVVLYLYFRPSVGSGTQVALARTLADRRIGRRPGEFVGVTGSLPAQHEQSRVINDVLLWVELASLALVVIAVGVHFRALGASLLVLATVVGAFILAARVVQTFANHAGLELPEEIKPVLVVLVFGIATDYSIFFMSRFREHLSLGLDRRAAGAQVIRETTPIVLAAGITVAAGTAALGVAGLDFLRAFGPGLAVAVLIAALSSAVFVPCVLATFGGRLYWPRGVGSPAGAGAQPVPQQTRAAPDVAAEPGPREQAAVVADGVAEPPAGEVAASRRPHRGPVGLAVRHPIVAATLALAAILAGASGLHILRIGDEVIRSLPAGNEVRRAYEHAGRGFVAGVVSPTVVVVKGPAVAERRAALDRFEGLLEEQPGVAGVVGPREQPLLARFGVAIARDGGAARYLLFLREDPLGPTAIAHVERLDGRLPHLLGRAGLSGDRALIAGDTALSASVVESVVGSLYSVGPAMLAGIFLALALFLRALVAPIYLVLTSALAAASALGLTAYVLQDLAGYDSVTYYVIFTVAVLLVSLGSDYNVFLVGRIWQEGRRRRRLPDAVDRAGRRAARPIRVAGLILAMSFALLAIVPIRGFREIAFGMGVGLVIDAFLVRAVLVPAVIVLVGRRSAWPGRGFSRGTPPGPEQALKRPAGDRSYG